MNKYYYEFQTIRNAGKKEAQQKRKKAKKAQQKFSEGVRPLEEIDDVDMDTESEEEEGAEDEDDDDDDDESQWSK